MKPQLLEGHYYGNIVRRGQMSNLILTETVYAPNTFVSNHSHANPYFCKILQGSYTETYEQRTRECGETTIAFHPQNEIHSERFHSSPVRSFNVEMTSAYAQQVRQHSDLLDRPAVFVGGTISWLATKMYQEFVRADSVSPLAMEGLALEIMAVASRGHGDHLRARMSAWLIRAKEVLDARFSEPLTVSEIAMAVDVHPVYLAREFRRHYKCTVGEYLRRVRTEFVCNQIRLRKGSLVEIAAQAGFFDQSHLSRTFKSLTGMTPGEYRSAHRSEVSQCIE